MNTTQPVLTVTDDTRNPGLTSLRSRVRDAWERLSKAERQVSNLLSGSTAERLLYASAVELGHESGTSNATVIRTLQSLGYSGLSELKQQVAAPFTSTVSPEVRLRRRMEHLSEDVGSIAAGVWAEAADRIELVRASADVDALSGAARLIADSSDVLAYGVGASRLAAEHLVLRLKRIGRPAHSISVDGFRLADELLIVRSTDVVVIFSPGRMIGEIDVILNRCHDVGAAVILVSDELGEVLRDRVSLTITAPHTPTGFTGEVLTSMLVGDVIVQSVAAIDRELAVETSHTLTTLRSSLGY